MVLLKNVSDSNHKSNKLWVAQSKEFYKKLTKKWLDNDVLMFLTYNECK